MTYLFTYLYLPILTQTVFIGVKDCSTMKFHILHYLALCLLKSIQILPVDCTCKLTPQVKIADGKKENKRMEGLAVINTTVGTAMECFANCVENCQCKSINVCGKTCQLNAGNQEDKSLSDSSDCTYYELSWEQQISVSKLNTIIRTI